jgi:tetratricopeptide (TPR) repeat protein
MKFSFKARKMNFVPNTHINRKTRSSAGIMPFNRLGHIFFTVSFTAGILLISSVSCDKGLDSVRAWGQRERWTKAKEINKDELEMWKKDFAISEDKVRELYKSIQLLTKESAHQGNLSWKIAKAYADQGRYELAEYHYRKAAEGSSGQPDTSENPDSGSYEKAIPYYQNALKNHVIQKDLLYDAALCYSNASKELGWDAERWDTAVYLFDTVLRIDPDDVRPLYPLALLYAKTGDESRRDTKKALELLDVLIKKQNQDVAARFAKAHILVETGDLDRALTEYRQIKEIIEDLHNTGLIKGSADKNPKYRKVSENIIKLERCTTDKLGCEIGTEQED